MPVRRFRDHRGAVHLRPVTIGDADAIAETTRAGFDSFREWAPASYDPPAAGARGRSHPRRAGPAGRLGPDRARRRGGRRARPARAGARARATAAGRSPGVRHLWQLFIRRPWWGAGLATELNRLRGRRGDAPRLRADAPAHARGPRPRARLLRARGLGDRRGRAARAAARHRAGAVPALPRQDPRPVIRRRAAGPELPDRAAPLLEEAAERSRISWRARVERLRLAWRSIFQAALSAGDRLAHRDRAARPSAGVLRAGLGDHHARPHRLPARAPGGRGRVRRRARASPSPTCSCCRSAPAPRR